MQVVAAVGRVLVKLPRGQLIIAPADLAQLRSGVSAAVRLMHVALFAPRHDGDGFVCLASENEYLSGEPA